MDKENRPQPTVADCLRMLFKKMAELDFEGTKTAGDGRRLLSELAKQTLHSLQTCTPEERNRLEEIIARNRVTRSDLYLDVYRSLLATRMLPAPELRSLMHLPEHGRLPRYRSMSNY